MHKRHWLAFTCLASFLLGMSASALAQDYPTVPYKQAAKHEGDIVWVEGKVLRTEKMGEGTYLLFSANKKYLRVLIPAASLKNFDGSIHHMYAGKKIKAVGKVQMHGTALILGVNEPERIRLVEGATD